jgi:sulfoxide reductase heme-binding subunit YedZ
LHFLNFYILDAQFDFAFVIKETLDKPFVYLGMISFVILLFMAITSTKKLFVKFNKQHKAVYLVLILVTIHASMAQKVLSSLEYTFIVVTSILLGYRVYAMVLQNIKV